MISGTFASRKAYTFLTGAFILHNLEEAITMNLMLIKSPVSFIQPPTYNQFLFAVTAITIAGIIAYVAAMRTKSVKAYLFISTAVAVSILFNAFIPHLLVALYTMKYTSGIVTAIFLNLPFSIYVLSKNKPSFESLKQKLIYIAVGFAAGYFLFAITMILSRLMF